MSHQSNEGQVNDREERAATLGKELAEAYRRDGIVRANGLFDAEELQVCKAAYDWSYANPGPAAVTLNRGTADEHFVDNANPAGQQLYRDLSALLPVASFLRALWGSDHAYYYAEEIFAKEGGRCGVSPWHQDTTYIPVGGDHWVNIWITFEPLPRANTLEVVRASHRGPRYGTTGYEGALPNLFPERPPTPDVQGDLARDPGSWEILGFETTPGDVIVLHPGALHGGAPVTPSCPDRHTLVVRYFGDDATFQRPTNTQEGFGLWKHLGELDDGEPLSKIYPEIDAS